MTVPTLMFAAVLALVACAIAAEKWTPAQESALQDLMDMKGAARDRRGATSPGIKTTEGNLKIKVDVGKSICFDNGEETCINDLATVKSLTTLSDEVENTLKTGLEEANSNIADLESKTDDVINVKMSGVADEQKALLKLVQSQAATIAELKASDAVRCGRPCFPGEYMEQACTGGSNPNPIVCGKCPTRTFSPGGLPAACSECTVCGKTHVKTNDCTTTSDSKCTACKSCPSDSFADKQCTDLSKDDHCKAMTKCVVGKTFEEEPGTALTDRQCKACTTCPENSFTALKCTPTEDARCSVCGSCAAGQLEVFACTPSQNVVCKNCRTCPNNYKTIGKCSKTEDTTCCPEKVTGSQLVGKIHDMAWWTSSSNSHQREVLVNNQKISMNRNCYRWEQVPAAFSGAFFPRGDNDRGRGGTTDFEAAEDIIVGIMYDGRSTRKVGDDLRCGGSHKCVAGFKLPREEKNQKLIFGGCHGKTTYWIYAKEFKKGARVKIDFGRGMIYWFADCAAKHKNLF